MLETDTSPLVRNYKHEVFEDAMRHIHFKFPTFTNIQKLDLSHQLLGDENCDRLCNSIMGSRVEFINLMGNRLTNFGIECISKIMRSLGYLKTLNLSWNEFDDRAVEYLTHPDRYSGTLQELDLQYNILTVDSAFHLAVMFSSNLTTSLTTLRIGGAIGRKAWGDEYLQVFLTSVMNNKVSQLQCFHIPDFVISDMGFQIILSLITCDHVNLRLLNINKNYIKNPSLRMAFLTALKVSKKRFEFQAVDCGFSQKTLNRINRSLARESREECCKWLDNSQYINLASRALYSFTEGKILYVRLNQVLLNMKRVEKASPFEKITSSFENDLLSNITTIVPNSANFIIKNIRNDLVILNNQVAFVHSLQEIKMAGNNKEMSDAHSNRSERNRTSDPLLFRIDATFRALKRYERISKLRFPHWNHSIENLLQVCRIVADEVDAKQGKRRYRTANTIPSEHSEWMQFALEDAYSHTIEQGYSDQFIIGLQCEQRLLRFCEVSRSLENSKTRVNDYEDYMRNAIPSCETLGLMAFYIHYAHVQYPKEKDKLNTDLSHMQLPPAIPAHQK